MTLPFLMPAILVLGLMSVFWSFNNFVYVWLATGAGPGTFTNVLATEIYLKAFVDFRLGYSSAIGMVMAIVMGAFGIVYLRLVARRATGGERCDRCRRTRRPAHWRDPGASPLARSPWCWHRSRCSSWSTRPSTFSFGSFRPGGGLLSAKRQLHLRNYLRIFQAGFGRFIINSVVICVAATLGFDGPVDHGGLCLLALHVPLQAHPLHRRSCFGQVFPWIVLINPLFVAFATMHLINSYVGMILTYTAFTIPFSVYMLVGYLVTVPKSLDEAALDRRRLAVAGHLATSSARSCCRASSRPRPMPSCCAGRNICSRSPS